MTTPVEVSTRTRSARSFAPARVERRPYAVIESAAYATLSNPSLRSVAEFPGMSNSGLPSTRAMPFVPSGAQLYQSTPRLSRAWGTGAAWPAKSWVNRWVGPAVEVRCLNTTSNGG